MTAGPALDFPLCFEPRRDEAVRPLVEHAARFLLESVPYAIDALILTGSVARGEGSVLLRADGCRLLGDIELLAILKEPFDRRLPRRELVELGTRASREVAGGQASIEYTPAGIQYLRRNIRPCIFAYDLLRHGKVVWGRPDILGEIAPFGIEAIPGEDALRLIMNRMVELLILEDETRRAGEPAEEHAYQLVKTTLDVAGSALAFAGRYADRYADRRDAFDSLLDSSADLRATLPDRAGFMRELDWATACKLAPTDDLLLDGHFEEGLRAVVTAAKRLWLWEVRRLLGRAAESFGELFEAYLGREPAWQRLRGWAKLYRHPLRPPGSVSLGRAARLLFKASPQTLTYGTALLTYWAATGEPLPGGPARAMSLLPVHVPGSRSPSIQEIGHLWRWLVRNN